MQEALTNSLKHAGRSQARVLVRYAPAALELEIVDTGHGAASPAHEGGANGGRGLIGMRERVALFGGALDAGPAPERGFRVRAPAPGGHGAMSARARTTVLIVDDQALVRAGFRLLMEASAGVEIVGEAADGLEAVTLARQVRLDVVLMDIRMPVMDGVEATRILTAPGPDPAPRVIILTTFDLDQYVYDALGAGASGFLLKDTRPADLLRAIDVVAAGEAMLDPAVTRRLIERFAQLPVPRAADPAALKDLSAREVEVLRLVARGGPAHGKVPFLGRYFSTRYVRFDTGTLP